MAKGAVFGQVRYRGLEPVGKHRSGAFTASHPFNQPEQIFRLAELKCFPLHLAWCETPLLHGFKNVGGQSAHGNGVQPEFIAQFVGPAYRGNLNNIEIRAQRA